MAEPARHSAHVLFRNVQHAARDELRRSSIGLAFSGLSAGLNIGFSFVAVAAVLTATGGSPMADLWAAMAYPVGFILVILARAQLFTENTLTPVILVLSDSTRRNLLNTARLWAIVLGANLLGAYLFALALSALSIAPHLDADWLRMAAEEAYRGGWQDLFLRAIFGGWLIALLVWIIHAGTGLLGEFVSIWLVAFLIQAAGFSHSVAGAVEVLYLANIDAISYLDWFANFQVPVTAGNIVGGVVFVALVNFGQAVGAGRDAERAARLERFRELRSARNRQREPQDEESEKTDHEEQR